MVCGVEVIHILYKDMCGIAVVLPSKRGLLDQSHPWLTVDSPRHPVATLLSLNVWVASYEALYADLSHNTGTSSSLK